MTATVTTTKQINLRQLDTELGGADLSMNEHGDSREVVAEATTQAALQAGVDAHVPANEAGNRATLTQQAKAAMDGNRAYLALGTPTAAQTTVQVKALTAQMTALARLATDQLEDVD